MADIIWTPPEGWVEETGAHVSFIAPCNCTTAGKLVIGENEYDIVNAVGETVTGVGGAFTSGAMLDFILDCENLNAYIQNQAFSIDRVYPVGSIYMSVNSTDPADLFGGTWSQIEDTFLLAAGSSYSAGETGGEAEHTLSVNELPSHNHGVNDVGNGSSGSGVFAETWTGGRNSRGLTTDYTGGGNAHNNMPPYLAVYMWQRTA